MTKYQNIVILTGAGLSAESGLGTFRGQGGLWENFRIEDVATPEGFARDPVRVHGFYNLRRSWHKQARPNAAHLALARLEREIRDVIVQLLQRLLVEHAEQRVPPHAALQAHARLRIEVGAATDGRSGMLGRPGEFIAPSIARLSRRRAAPKPTERPGPRGPRTQ